MTDAEIRARALLDELRSAEIRVGDLIARQSDINNALLREQQKLSMIHDRIFKALTAKPTEHP